MAETITLETLERQLLDALERGEDTAALEKQINKIKQERVRAAYIEALQLENKKKLELRKKLAADQDEIKVIAQDVKTFLNLKKEIVAEMDSVCSKVSSLMRLRNTIEGRRNEIVRDFDQAPAEFVPQNVIVPGIVSLSYIKPPEASPSNVMVRTQLATYADFLRDALQDFTEGTTTVTGREAAPQPTTPPAKGLTNKAFAGYK